MIQPAPRTAIPIKTNRIRAFVCFALLLLAVGGCGSSSETLTLKSIEHKAQFVGRFSRAYFTRAGSGEYDVVLIDDGMLPDRRRQNAILQPTPTATLSQTVHLRVLWEPQRGAKSDTPSATNSVIDWYLFSNESSSHEDHLHYHGAGFVYVSDSTEVATFDIRSAKLEPAEQTGPLRDPLGPTTLVDRITAIRNDGMVASVLDSLRENVARSQSGDTGAHQGPPPRADGAMSSEHPHSLARTVYIPARD